MPTTIKTNSNNPIFTQLDNPKNQVVKLKTTRQKLDNGDSRTIKESTISDGVDTTYAPATKIKIHTTPYAAGRKDPSFVKEDPNNTNSYPKNENKEKQGMRIITQKQKKEMYDYNGKKEFAGIPEKKDTTYSDTLIPRYQQKYKIVSDTTDAHKIERGEPKGKPSIKPQKRAPGHDGENKLQRRY